MENGEIFGKITSTIISIVVFIVLSLLGVKTWIADKAGNTSGDIYGMYSSEKREEKKRQEEQAQEEKRQREQQAREAAERERIRKAEAALAAESAALEARKRQEEFQKTLDDMKRHQEEFQRAQEAQRLANERIRLENIRLENERKQREFERERERLRLSRIRDNRNNAVNNWKKRISYLEDYEDNLISLTIRNNCYKKILVAIHYKDLTGNWVTEGWWSIDGYEEKYPNIRTSNGYIYIYAHSEDNKFEWPGNNATRKIISSQSFTRLGSDDLEGMTGVKSVYFHSIITDSDSYTHIFSCN